MIDRTGVGSGLVMLKVRDMQEGGDAIAPPDNLSLRIRVIVKGHSRIEDE